MLIGNGNNDPSSNFPFNGDFGPRFYVLNSELTAAEEAALMGFQQPV